MRFSSSPVVHAIPDPVLAVLLLLLTASCSSGPYEPVPGFVLEEVPLFSNCPGDVVTTVYATLRHDSTWTRGAYPGRRYYRYRLPDTTGWPPLEEVRGDLAGQWMPFGDTRLVVLAADSTAAFTWFRYGYGGIPEGSPFYFPLPDSVRASQMLIDGTFVCWTEGVYFPTLRLMWRAPAYQEVLCLDELFNYGRVVFAPPGAGFAMLARLGDGRLVEVDAQGAIGAEWALEVPGFAWATIHGGSLIYREERGDLYRLRPDGAGPTLLATVGFTWLSGIAVVGDSLFVLRSHDTILPVLYAFDLDDLEQAGSLLTAPHRAVALPYHVKGGLAATPDGRLLTVYGNDPGWAYGVIMMERDGSAIGSWDLPFRSIRSMYYDGTVLSVHPLTISTSSLSPETPTPGFAFGTLLVAPTLWRVQVGALDPGSG